MYRVSIVRKSLAIYTIVRLINDFFSVKKKPPKPRNLVHDCAHAMYIFI